VNLVMFPLATGLAAGDEWVSRSRNVRLYHCGLIPIVVLLRPSAVLGKKDARLPSAHAEMLPPPSVFP